jgi:predicted N-acyltransferase
MDDSLKNRQNAHSEATAADAEAAPDRIRVVPRIADLDAAAWDALTDGSPCVAHAFLAALERTGCVGTAIGWEPVHLALFRDGHLAAAMPLYLKHHSWGEFVFDWSWADAYRRQGLAYYPKLVCCVPFSPVPGPRLLAHDDGDRAVLLDAARALVRDLNCSSFHVLFPGAPDHDALAAAGMLHRTGFQFHWHNAGYADFDAFLAALTHDRRKKIRQERKKLASLGVTFRWIEGAQSRDADWAFFYRCYADTYARHRSEPHLNRAFFEALRSSIPDSLLLIVAERHGVPIACSFCLKDGERLYGRHWGTLEYLPGLHFETCYQQGIEYAIAHGLRVFEGGAQGEHKLARGLVPTVTHSWHWLEHPELRNAIDRFLERETEAVAHYMDELEGPFRREPPS